MGQTVPVRPDYTAGEVAGLRSARRMPRKREGFCRLRPCSRERADPCDPRRGPGRIASQPLFSGLEKVFRPAVIKVLDDTLGSFSRTDFCLILEKATMSQNPPFLNPPNLSHEC
jgi:hypothetical protein